MLKTSTISISMDTGINSNVVSTGNIRVTSFRMLKDIFNQTQIFFKYK